jgi:hypothetical protein
VALENPFSNGAAGTEVDIVGVGGDHENLHEDEATWS